MKTINSDEKIGKTVGRRKMGTEPVAYGLDLQATVSRLCPLSIPRGVYKFRTHQEADEWMTRKGTQ